MARKGPLFVKVPNLENLLENVLICSIRPEDEFTGKIINFSNNDLRQHGSPRHLDQYGTVSNAREYRNREFCPTLFSHLRNMTPAQPGEIPRRVKEKSVYVIATSELHLDGLTSFSSAQEIVMRSCITARAAKKAGARRVTLVLPLVPYSRQDPKEGDYNEKYAGQADSLNLSLSFYKSAGVDEIMTFFPHSDRLSVLCGENGLQLSVLPHISLFGHYALHNSNWEIRDNGANIVFAAPDQGSWETVKEMMRIPGLTKASGLFYRKIRKAPNDPTKVIATPDHISHNFTTLNDKTFVFVDDQLDTCGTVYAAGRTVLEDGVPIPNDGISKPKDIVIMAGHPVFSGLEFVAPQRLLNFSGVKEVVFGNSCPTYETHQIGDLKKVSSVLRLAGYFQNAIIAREQEMNLSKVFSVEEMLANPRGFGYLYDVRRSTWKE